jgi:heat shock protein HslJ
MTKLRFAAIPLAAVVLAACTAAGPAATSGPGGLLNSTISNTDWVLSTLGDTPLVSGTEVTLQFALLKAAGFGGCNQFNATYASDGASTLTFGPIAATRIFCAGGAGAFETAYFTALGLVRKFTIDGANLKLSGENGAELMTFAAAAPATVEGPWIPTAVNNGSGAVSSVPAGIAAAFSFLPDGTMEGFGGCNNFSGQYVVDGDSIEIGPIAATMMACSDAINAFESQFLTALQSSTTWSVSSGTLDLRDGDGAQQVQAASAIGR